MPTTVTSHIEIDDAGVAWIIGANTKVVEVVRDKLAHGWGPEEIHREHPHLSLAQIHSAFAYYYENQEKMDGEIDRREHEAEEIARQAADPALRRKLLDLKKQLSAEGTEVRVEPRGPKTLAEHFKGVIGTVHGGPPDWAKNHDHYIHGTPKK
ncbi:MAG TPA: DUF433 domain-containing protein [Terriglobia bacterium]|nr:DUF433 domain-containing protein [Terriglobia bacterium]